MVFQFLVLIGSCVWIYYAIYRGKLGIMPLVRRIPGLDALEEAVGRATELDKPVYITPGGGGLQDEGAVQTLAGLSVMEYVVKMAARYQARFWVSMRAPEVFPVADEMVRNALATEGRMDLYKDDSVEFFSGEQFAFAMGTLSRWDREGLAAAVLVGFFQAESLLLAEGAAQHGAITIGGCARTSQVPFFVVSCDYVLIGEEMLVAGAYLSKDAVQLGTLWGQDILKIIAVGFLLLGVVLNAAGNKVLFNLIKW
jgi:hypothetical protein